VYTLYEIIKILTEVYFTMVHEDKDFQTWQGTREDQELVHHSS